MVKGRCFQSAKQVGFVHFRVLSRFGTPTNPKSCACLHTDDWDDFSYKTLYQLAVYDEDGLRHRIGNVKIGQFSMSGFRISIPPQFEQLDERYFSLGGDESYYEGLNKLGAATRDRILEGLRDLSLDKNLFERALKEKVTGVSLLRSIRRRPSRGNMHGWLGVALDFLITTSLT